MRRRSFLALALSVPVVAACSNRESAQTAPSSSAGASGGTSRTIAHGHGETVITGTPRRIVTVGWSDQDTVVALGIKPIAATAITWGGNANQSTDWFDEAVAKLDGPDVIRFLDADGIPVDQIATMNPDLILGVGSGMSADEYAKLSRIAPTVPYLKVPWGTTWDDQTATIGMALGLTSEAAALIDKTNLAIDDAVAKHPEITGKSAAWAWFTPTDLSTIGLYTVDDLRPAMLRRFGMVDSPTVVELSQDGGFLANLSAERASELEADVLIWYGSSVTPEALKADPLLSRIPALASGHYYAPTDDHISHSMSAPTPLSIPVMLEHMLPGIAKAAAGQA